jgi:single-stranded-DNA-specific exonuclease
MNKLSPPERETAWTPRALDPDADEAARRSSRWPPLAVRLLAARGLDSDQAVEAFLSPRLPTLPKPASMADMDRAAALMADAVEAGEAVAVLGDYDVDGITSVAQVLWFLRGLGVHVVHSIPHRVRDGYGLDPGAIAALVEQGVRLFVTVDTGIGEHETIAKMKARGAQVIVIDHHKIERGLPPADAVLNPKREDCGFPSSDLAACGLTFFFLGAVKAALTTRGWFERQGMTPTNLRGILDLVGLGTIADVVPLVGVNRTLARHGLMQLRALERPGLKRLVEVAGIRTRRLDAGHVGFQLGPRLNAAGRIDHADLALELLMTEDDGEARRLAARLNELNRERQGLERDAQAAAVAQIEADPERHLSGGAVVVAGEGWHVGVVGITASRLVERYGRPALVLTRDGDVYRGSGRSVPGFDLIDALGDGASLMAGYGGHAMACGVSVAHDGLDAFADWFRAHAGERLTDDMRLRRRYYDAEVRLADVMDEAFGGLYRELWPFGQANPRPVFLAREVQLVEVLRQSGRLTRYRVRQGDVETTLSMFGDADGKPPAPARVDLLFHLDLFDWKGIETTGLTADDYRMTGGRDATDA